MVALMRAAILLIAASAVSLFLGWRGSNVGLIWASIGATAAAGVLLALVYGSRTRAGAPSQTSGRAAGEATRDGAAEPASAWGAPARPAPTEQLEPAVGPEAERAPEPAAAQPLETPVEREPAASERMEPTPQEGAERAPAGAPAGAEPAEPVEAPARRARKRTARAAPAPSGRRARADATERRKAAADRTRRPRAAAEESVGGEAQIKEAPARRTASASEVVALPDRGKFHRPECRFATAKGAQRISRATARRRGYEACAICKP